MWPSGSMRWCGSRLTTSSRPRMSRESNGRPWGSGPSTVDLLCRGIRLYWGSDGGSSMWLTR
eukprot:11158560-Lingulodinium_polyedra.AAC.1